MTTAFQADAFQTNAFQIDVAPATSAGGWIVRHRMPSGGYRKKDIDEAVEALRLRRAMAAADARAERAKGERKAALETAVRASQEAYEAAEQAYADDISAIAAALDQLAAALEKMSSARTLAGALTQMQAAQAMAAHVRELIEEEHVIELLLLHS